MAIKDFFRSNIKTEEMMLKKHKDAIMGVSVLEALMGGVMVLGSMAGIFTIPSLLAFSIPALIGLSTIGEVKKNIKDSKSRIESLKNMEENGVNASRNHERHRKIEELKEDKKKAEAENTKFNKVMIGGIAAFALGGFAPFVGALAAPLMVGGYGTMLYGLYKSSETANKGRDIQNKIERLKDAVAASNVNPRFVTVDRDDDIEFAEEKKADKKVEKKPIKKSKREALIDEYVENMSKQLTEEEENHKTK